MLLESRLLLVLPSLVCLATQANARSCHIQPFTFNYTAPGPWPAHMRVQSGKSCGSRSWSTGGIFKGLYLTSAPRHGKVALAFPGAYRYFLSPTYVGDDSFTLKICGTGSTGNQGCSEIAFSVSVVPGGF